MPKVPAAEELVTVTYTLREIELVGRALVTKRYEYEEAGETSARALGVTQSALRKTNVAVKLAIRARKCVDV